jgi:hypothetical protein
MSRIRSIKPEFWASEQVVECSPTARLLFIGLWTFCDDAGVHPASIKRTKMEVFPGDPMKDADVQRYIEELINVGLLRPFSAEGKHWWAVTGWHHQKIDKPTYRYPSPPPSGDVGDMSPPETSREDRSRSQVPNGTSGKPDEASVSPAPTNEKPQKPRAPKPEDGVYEFPIIGRDSQYRSWWLVARKIDEYRQSFPGVDIDRIFKAARQWCIDNPTQRKTCRGMPAFLTKWITRQQNSGAIPPLRAASAPNPSKIRPEEGKYNLGNLNYVDASTPEPGAPAA